MELLSLRYSRRSPAARARPSGTRDASGFLWSICRWIHLVMHGALTDLSFTRGLYRTARARLSRWSKTPMTYFGVVLYFLEISQGAVLA
jgi:hypothetical protein